MEMHAYLSDVNGLKGVSGGGAIYAPFDPSVDWFPFDTTDGVPVIGPIGTAMPLSLIAELSPQAILISPPFRVML